jgi:hypothetical protein
MVAGRAVAPAAFIGGGFPVQGDKEEVQNAFEDHRWDELKFIQDTVHKVWSAYLIYFIWFHTGVYAALSFAMGTGPKTPTRNVVLVAVVVITASELLSMAVTIALAVYSKSALKRVEVIVREGNFHPGVNSQVLLPGHAIQVVAVTCILSFIVSTFACLYVALVSPA